MWMVHKQAGAADCLAIREQRVHGSGGGQTPTSHMQMLFSDFHLAWHC